MQVKGRAEILGIMARRKYNEIMQVRRAERTEGGAVSLKPAAFQMDEMMIPASSSLDPLSIELSGFRLVVVELVASIVYTVVRDDVRGRSCAAYAWRSGPWRGTQKELEKRKLQTSGLGMLFHLRDLLGSRKLTRVETTCGTMLRLRKD